MRAARKSKGPDLSLTGRTRPQPLSARCTQARGYFTLLIDRSALSAAYWPPNGCVPSHFSRTSAVNSSS
jgi:hypothetical protein